MLNLKSSDRVFITGMTGSGKTYFIKKVLMLQYKRFILYDYKGEYGDVKARHVSSIEDLSAAIKAGYCKIVFNPYYVNDAVFNELCLIVFRLGNMALIVDELGSHAEPHKILENHSLLLRQGRGRGVGLINGTQRPNDTHNNVLSEAEHYFIFFLTLPSDKRKIEGIVGQPLGWGSLKEFEYFYCCPKRRLVQKMGCC